MSKLYLQSDGSITQGIVYAQFLNAIWAKKEGVSIDDILTRINNLLKAQALPFDVLLHIDNLVLKGCIVRAGELYRLPDKKIWS